MKNILFSYPHSSSNIPQGLENKLNVSKEDLIITMDFGTEKFFSGLDSQKLFAEVHLLFGNLNRNISGYHLFTGEKYNTAMSLFPLNLPHNGKNIYKEGEELSEAEKLEIAEKYYIPYYKKISEFILSGKIDLLIDVHSCDPVASGNQAGNGERADIILGNRGDENGNIKNGRDYVTFSPELIQKLRNMLEKHGLKVAINTPFLGGNITQQFGYSEGIDGKIPTLQIEINKKLYMEDDLLKVDETKFDNINNILSESIKSL
ncbi:MAG: N-formylglutamate amidohydrolase [Candidatus Gracilibacteria bacterium]|nr:N-formylglutamate amidohydrolase [Candidatus Gracilibacteria bacterium]